MYYRLYGLHVTLLLVLAVTDALFVISVNNRYSRVDMLQNRDRNFSIATLAPKSAPVWITVVDPPFVPGQTFVQYGGQTTSQVNVISSASIAPTSFFFLFLIWRKFYVVCGDTSCCFVSDNLNKDSSPSEFCGLSCFSIVSAAPSTGRILILQQSTSQIILLVLFFRSYHSVLDCSCE